MISRAGTVWLVLGFVAAVAAFTVKYEVRDLEARLTGVEGDIAEAREEIHVLKAEWSYLNRPDRLAELAERHLDLEPMVATQMVSLLDVPLRVAPAEPFGEGLEDELNTLVTYRVDQP